MKTFIKLVSLIKESKDHTLDYETVNTLLEDIIFKGILILDVPPSEYLLREPLKMNNLIDLSKQLIYFEEVGPTATHPIRTEPKISRNSLCKCGSNKKYKNCCINK